MALTALFVATSAIAGFQGNNTTQQQGGFNSNQSVVVNTVAQALSANDDAPAQLTGSIVRQLKDNDEFIFRDATGEIKIDVDDDAWQGQNVSVNDKITIYGKVDKEHIGNNTLDVYRVQKH